MRNRTFRLRAPRLAGYLAFALTVPCRAIAAPADDGHVETVLPAAEAAPQSFSETLISPYPAEARGDGPRTGPNYFMLRNAEDWRFLANPEAKRDWAAGLKYIPLDAEGYASLSLNGDQRSLVSLSTRPQLSDTTDRIEVRSRTTLGADLRIGPAMRVYGALAVGKISGKNESKHTPNQDNDLIVQQLFAEFRAPVGSGVAQFAIGRQEFFDGPRFLITPRESPNIRVSMNGARLSVDWQTFRFSAFRFVPTAPGNGGVFDDKIGNGETLSGIYANSVISGGRGAGRDEAIFFDPFYYHYTNEKRTLGPLSGPDRRETYGARLWGHAGPFSFDWTAIKQDGQFVGREVDAWAASLTQAMALGSEPMAPKLGFHANYASGGGTFSDEGAINSFNFLYNATVIFSDDNYLGAINLMGVAPTLLVPVTNKLKLTGEVGFYWRPEEDDAVYRGNSVPYSGTQDVEGKQVAQIARLRANWAVNPHVAVEALVNHVEAGKVLRRAGYGDNLFARMMVTLRF